MTSMILRSVRHSAPWLVLAALIVTAIGATSPDDPVAARDDAPSAMGPDRGPATSLPDEAAVIAPGASERQGGAATTPRLIPGTASVIGRGVSVFGVNCATSARQLPVSAYGPRCQSASNGKNPGATAPGVTGTAINVTLRKSEGGQSAAMIATAGTAADSLGGDQDGVAADMQTLVDYFNRVFDLYGRKVQFKVYDGQGDFLAEFQNQNIQGAQADGARARDLGAFADTSLITMTQPYGEALASQRIIGMSPLYLSEAWHRAHAPYAFGVVWPIGTRTASFVGNLACRRLANGNATAASDSSLRGQRRVFGLIHPENPEFASVADIIDRTLRACGHAPARRIAYTLNIATAQSQHTNAIAQMKDAGVTTVLCQCDQFSPIFLTRAADQQHYGPEWVQLWWPDPWQRLANESQWSHSIHTGGTSPDYFAGEVGAVWRAAANGAPPRAAAVLPLVYQQVLSLFAGLQAAGPNLTPESFQRGWFSLPDTAAGDFGPWEFGPGMFNPRVAVPGRLVRPECTEQLRRPGRRHSELRRWCVVPLRRSGLVRLRTAWVLHAMTPAQRFRRYAGLVVVLVLLLIVVFVAPTRIR